MPSFHSADLHIEGSFYIGAVLSAAMYGIYLGIYCLSISALAINKNTTHLHRYFYIVFSSISLLLNTITFVSFSYTGQMMWIVKRNTYPGGPLEYFDLEATKALVNVLGNVTQTLAITLNDGLLVYRCYVIFGSRLYIVTLPVLCSLTSLVLGIILIPILLSPSPEPQHLDQLNAVIVTLNTTVNVMVTAMISIKILSVSRILSKCNDPTPAHTRTYMNVVAILVESAAPCAAFGMLSSIQWFMEPCLSNFCFDSEFISLGWIMSMMLFPQLIIYRVATGSAWTEKTSQKSTHLTGSLAFAPREMDTEVLGFRPNAPGEGVHHQPNEGTTFQSVIDG